MDNQTINRATGLLVIEVVNSNPNGDPDRESDPRQRADGRGEISPVSFKRKLRDLVENTEGAVFQTLKQRLQLEDGRYCILESRGIDRNKVKNEMSEDIKHFDQSNFLGSDFVRKYWDARIFGNTFLEENGNKGYIKTGVVQFGMGLSIARIEVERQTNTCKSGKQEGKNQGMAPLAYRVVTHGVYCMPFFVNPTHAHKSGCTRMDIELMKALIPYAYDHTRSAIRPDVRIRHAWYVEHKDPLGSCPDYLLLEALTPKVADDARQPMSWADYTVPTSLPTDLEGRVYPLVDLAALTL